MRFRSLFRRKTVESILAKVQHSGDSGGELRRNLGVFDLTALGIAAVIGAGIFSTIGTAAAHGGPAVSLLFVFTAIACGFSALCYAQFASAIPISGSAYTYAYATFGELIAWIIGWDLIMEYAVGNIAVAISWSDYFTALMNGMGISLPSWICIDYLSASRGFHQVEQLLHSGLSWNEISFALQESWQAWQQAPVLGGVRIIADIPAFTIVALITMLVYIGIKESKIAGNIMVLLKVGILLLVIAVGAFYVNPTNWHPFAPNGLGGVLKGVAGVFFAYIGFDAISTTAEECKNPRRDLPRAMILALIITTVLYVIISLILTGIVPYHLLNVGDPLSFVFQQIGQTRFSGIIALSAIIAMASVLLVFQVGQPRIWMSMSRDGLLPKRFGKIHPRFKTPSFSTLLTGFMVAIPSLFVNLTEMTDLTSIGTLFAFVLVCGGVLLMNQQTRQKASFKVLYINSRYVLPLLWLGILLLSWKINPDFFSEGRLFRLFHHFELPVALYFFAALIISFFAIWKKWSLIPVAGLLINLYLMSQLGVTNWMRFLLWLVIGLTIYFSYGYRSSRLKKSLSLK